MVSHHPYSHHPSKSTHKRALFFLWATFLALNLFCEGTALAQQPTGGSGAFLGVRMDRTSAGQVRLTAILPGSPAAQAGLSSGDLLIELGGRPVSATSDVVERVQATPIGGRLIASILREGQPRSLTVSLGRAPARGQILQAFVGHQAPQIRLPRFDGSGAVDLSALRGQVVVLYFWSVFCPACRMSTPDLNRLEQTYRSRGVSVFAISDNEAEEIRGSSSASQLSMPLLHDVGSKISGDYWISAVPSVFVIDQGGRVAFVGEGWDSRQGAALDQILTRLLQNTTP